MAELLWLLRDAVDDFVVSGVDVEPGGGDGAALEWEGTVKKVGSESDMVNEENGARVKNFFEGVQKQGHAARDSLVIIRRPAPLPTPP